MLSQKFSEPLLGHSHSLCFMNTFHHVTLYPSSSMRSFHHARSTKCHVTIMHETSSLQAESDLTSLVPRPPPFSIPLALAVIRKIHRSLASVYYCECTQNVQWESLRPCPVLSYASLLPNLPNFCCSVCIHEWKQKNGENFAALPLP